MPIFDKVGNFADNQPYPLLVALQFILQVSSTRPIAVPRGKKRIASDCFGCGACPPPLSVSMCPQRGTSVVNAAGLRR